MDGFNTLTGQVKPPEHLISVLKSYHLYIQTKWQLRDEIWFKQAVLGKPIGQNKNRIFDSILSKQILIQLLE
jgi:hypothetical protein